jgi:dTMP kinase
MFICLEGVDGAGKSTQSRLLYDYFKRRGAAVELVSDPGTTKLGKTIRQLVLDCDDPISSHAQMLLFSAARAELSQHIREQIAAGVVVICDRWILSTLVYQADLNDISPDFVMNVFKETGVVPDLCLLLDIDPTVADARKAHELRKDRYERVNMERKQFMRQCYLKHSRNRACAKATAIIDADDNQSSMHAKIVDAVRDNMPAKNIYKDVTCAQNA